MFNGLRWTDKNARKGKNDKKTAMEKVVGVL